ncbi:MAG: transglycosylase domain-containing protein, partial [Myxococcota bacterium]|nr:transglycosylase domain-containing protein [Myxococcota bacterium]
METRSNKPAGPAPWPPPMQQPDPNDPEPPTAIMQVPPPEDDEEEPELLPSEQPGPSARTAAAPPPSHREQPKRKATPVGPATRRRVPPGPGTADPKIPAVVPGGLPAADPAIPAGKGEQPTTPTAPRPRAPEASPGKPEPPSGNAAARPAEAGPGADNAIASGHTWSAKRTAPVTARTADKGPKKDRTPPGAGKPKTIRAPARPRPAAPGEAKRVRKPKAARKTAKGPKKPGLIRRILFGKWMRRFVFLCLLLTVAALVGLYIGYRHYSKDLPSVQALQDYRPPVVTEIYAADGRLAGEVYDKQRYVIPYTRIPDHMIYAVVAAEDAQFFEHHGIDYMGIVRAMIRNVQAGEFTQGASTITQQVARSFLLTREKTITRKLKEAILAYRIEANFSKEYILYLYLNQIFLGHGAYGVEAASRLYFDKHIEDVSLAEAALIAGLPQAPSNYSPNNNHDAAKVRQRFALDQMASGGFISQVQADAAYDQPLQFYRKHDRNLDVGPYFVEHVRRYLLDQYGHDMAYKDGLTVYTTMDSELQLAANQAVQRGVREVDHRVGLYEKFTHLESGAVAAELAKIDLDRYLASLP